MIPHSWKGYCVFTLQPVELEQVQQGGLGICLQSWIPYEILDCANAYRYFREGFECSI